MTVPPASRGLYESGLLTGPSGRDTLGPIPSHTEDRTMPTLAIHLVWTAYGTWLPGDPRGHWSPLFDLYGRLAQRGGRLGLPDAVTRQVALSQLKESPKVLTPEEITAVAACIGEQFDCSVKPDSTKPRAFSAALEPTHVHLLLGPVQENIAQCAGRLKGKSSSKVLELPSNAGRQRTWTQGYWRVFLYDAQAVLAVKEYIDAHNIRRGLPADPYPWISPLEL
jgi:hypothetical protein